MKFVNHNTPYDPPEPVLLEIYTIITRILHATGKAEQIDKLRYKKDHTGALAKDGSTNIVAIVSVLSLKILSSLPRLPNPR